MSKHIITGNENVLFNNNAFYCIGTGRMGLALQKQYYEQLPQTPFYQVYCEKQMIIGKPILFSDTDGMKRGTAIGIDEEFRLVVQTSDGETHSLERGEVTVM